MQHCEGVCGDFRTLSMLACIWDCSDRNCVEMGAWGGEHWSMWKRSCGWVTVLLGACGQECGRERVDRSEIFFNIIFSMGMGVHESMGMRV